MPITRAVVGLVVTLSVLVAGTLLTFIHGMPAAHANAAFSPDDVFVGVGNGQILHYSPTGTLVGTLDTTTGCI